MSEIQRYWPDIEGIGVLRAVMRPIPDDFHPDDEYVTYADHVAAVAAAEQRKDSEWRAFTENNGGPGYLGYEQGQRDERARIRAAIEALPKMNVNAGIHSQPPPLYVFNREQVLAAIDGEQ